MGVVTFISIKSEFCNAEGDFFKTYCMLELIEQIFGETFCPYVKVHGEYTHYYAIQRKKSYITITASEIMQWKEKCWKNKLAFSIRAEGDRIKISVTDVSKYIS